MSEQQSAVERLADQWNATPDWAPTVYDHGRVDQRHEMTMQLLEAIEADRARAGAVAEEPEWEPEYASGPSPQALVRTSRRGDRYAHETAYERKVTPWVPVKQEGTER